MRPSSKVLYFNAQKLLHKPKVARSGALFKLFGVCQRWSLLILDDFGLANLRQKQQQGLMEIIEDSTGIIPTIMPVNSVASWMKS